MSHPDYSVRILPAAEDDLTEIVLYIAADRPSAAERLASQIEERLTLLSERPLIGRKPRDPDLARSGYRFLAIGACLIFYIVEGNTVYVHRILHGARDYRRLL